MASLASGPISRSRSPCSCSGSTWSLNTYAVHRINARTADTRASRPAVAPRRRVQEVRVLLLEGGIDEAARLEHERRPVQRLGQRRRHDGAQRATSVLGLTERGLEHQVVRVRDHPRRHRRSAMRRRQARRPPSHGPADPGSFDAVSATTLRLRSALRPSAPNSPRLTRWPWGRNDPHRRPRTPATGASPGRTPRSAAARRRRGTPRAIERALARVRCRPTGRVAVLGVTPTGAPAYARRYARQPLSRPTESAVL
jgi:hypothetical protein